MGPQGRITGTPRLTSAEGPLADTFRETFLEPVDRRIASSGLDLDDPGRPAPPYLPRLLEEPVSPGEGWSVLERAPNGEDVEAAYRLESLTGSLATLVGRSAAGETVMEFCLVEGRVRDARAVLSSGPLQISLWYRLSPPGA